MPGPDSVKRLSLKPGFACETFRKQKKSLHAPPEEGGVSIVGTSGVSVKIGMALVITDISSRIPPAIFSIFCFPAGSMPFSGSISSPEWYSLLSF
jgi:hypothetical protein